METLQAFNVPLYKFQCDKNLSDDVLQYVNNLKYDTDKNFEYGYLYPNFYHEALINWFNDCVSQVAKLYYYDTLTFPIVDCWLKKSHNNTTLHKHNHSNSTICGLYYVNSTDTGRTIWELKNPWNFYQEGPTFNLWINKDKSPLTFPVLPEKGKLILFPSNLYHYMDTYCVANWPPVNDSSTERCTIAFNTFPSGIVSSHYTKQLRITSHPITENTGKTE